MSCLTDIFSWRFVVSKVNRSNVRVCFCDPNQRLRSPVLKNKDPVMFAKRCKLLTLFSRHFSCHIWRLSRLQRHVRTRRWPTVWNFLSREPICACVCFTRTQCEVGAYSNVVKPRALLLTLKCLSVILTVYAAQCLCVLAFLSPASLARCGYVYTRLQWRALCVHFGLAGAVRAAGGRVCVCAPTAQSSRFVHCTCISHFSQSVQFCRVFSK